jgi:hypothetical protein
VPELSKADEELVAKMMAKGMSESDVRQMLAATGGKSKQCSLHPFPAPQLYILHSFHPAYYTLSRNIYFSTSCHYSGKNDLVLMFIVGLICRRSVQRCPP